MQKVIEKLTASNLETLAKQHVFGPLHMDPSTTFLVDKNKPLAAWAENSLQTTPTDYAKFINALMHDKALQHAFDPQVFMTEDKGIEGAIGVAKGNIPEVNLSHVAWGLGWGIQTDDSGKPVTAYHSGDMNECRAWVAINLENKTAIVFFANSSNGHILAEQVIPPSFKLDHAANYFFSKWGFARNLEELEPSWREKQNWGLKRQTSEPKAEATESVHPNEDSSTRIMRLLGDAPAPKPSPIEDVPKDSTPPRPPADDARVRKAEANAASETPPDGSSFNPTPFSTVPKPEKN